MFHILVDNSVSYFCMADKEFGNRIPFMFLDDIKNRFVAQYPNFSTQFKQALPNSLNRDFGRYAIIFFFHYANYRVLAFIIMCRVLQKQMEHFSDASKSDKFAQVKGQLQEVKGIMIDNIEKVLERGERIELLVDRTNDLSDSATDFKFRSKKLKNTVWWKNVKLILLLVFIILVVLAGIIWLICGIPDFKTCRSWFSSSS